MSSSTTVSTSKDSLAGSLRFSITRLSRLLRREDESGLSPTLTAALATINAEGPLTLGSLAKKERVSPPTITNAVAKLELKGLVRRREDEIDKRSTQIEITAAGRKRLDVSRLRRTAWLESRIQELSKDEQKLLSQAAPVLRKLVEGSRSEEEL